MHAQYTYLALGDSYTIGESVLLQKNFPYQTVQLLRKQGFNFLENYLDFVFLWSPVFFKMAFASFAFFTKKGCFS